jgi:hypothetical protein
MPQMILPTRNVLISSSMRWRTVSADGAEVFLPDALEANGLVELSFRSRVLLEPARKVGAQFGFVARGVKRRPAALRGRERDLSPSFLENVVGSSELFEPEARLSSGVTQLVVGCDTRTTGSPPSSTAIAEM